ETPVALFRRDLAQDVPELGLERRECLNQRGGVELAGDAGRERVGRIVGKVRFVSLCVQHRGRSSLLLGEHRLAAVKVGLSMSCRLCFAVACGGGVTPGLPATRDEVVRRVRFACVEQRYDGNWRKLAEPSRAMRAGRSTSQERYSRIAAARSLGRS